MNWRKGFLPLLAAALWTLAGCSPVAPTDPEILARLPEIVDYNHHIKPLSRGELSSFELKKSPLERGAAKRRGVLCDAQAS